MRERARDHVDRADRLRANVNAEMIAIKRCRKPTRNNRPLTNSR
jgi:hypothetical protein